MTGFSIDDRRDIHAYYYRSQRLPPGLAKRDQLLPAHYIRLQMGRDIVLMDKRTRITVDVIKNVFP